MDMNFGLSLILQTSLAGKRRDQLLIRKLSCDNSPKTPDYQTAPQMGIQ